LQEHQSNAIAPSPRLFHFSERGGIARFEPRPVEIPSRRPPGRAWLNGPLVWAVEAARQPLYLFPRECPRVLLWAREDSLAEERAQWLGEARFAAYIESGWADRVRQGVIWRYGLPPETFEDLGDAGMWVSRQAVTPLAASRLTDLPAELAAHGVDLRVVDSLAPLAPLWRSSLHASGVRLRNSVTWPGSNGSDGL
jgi:hypothetical protein